MITKTIQAKNSEFLSKLRLNSRQMLWSVLLVLLGVSFSKPALSQTPENGEITRILFVLDASASMKKNWDTRTRWTAAKQILTSITDSLNNVPNVEIGLRVYGHQTPSSARDCEDTRLEVTIGKNNAAYIQKRLSEIKPKGITPIAYSLQKAANDFPSSSGRNILILITDGEESCEKNVCEISRALQKNNAMMKPFIIGIDIPDYAIAELECIGNLQQSNRPDEFRNKLDIVLNRALATTTVQVNLLDDFDKPTETNVNMTFHDSQTEFAKYNFYHTINHKGNPDTLYLDPVYNYDMVVHTIPPVRKNDIVLKANSHNIIDLKAPQGYLKLEIQGEVIKNDVQKKIKCIVKEDNQFKTLHIQPLNSTEKYLTGVYDLELLTLPRIKLEDVTIEQSLTKTIAIPAPGILNLNKSFEVFGGIFIIDNNRMKKIYELKTDLAQESIALQPGKYRLVYRPKNSKTMHSTIDKEIVIISGKLQALKL